MVLVLMTRTRPWSLRNQTPVFLQAAVSVPRTLVDSKIKGTYLLPNPFLQQFQQAPGVFYEPEVIGFYINTRSVDNSKGC